MTKTIYSITGILLGAVVNILINLLSSAIQQKAFHAHFNQQSIWWLMGFLVAGLLTGYWLSGNVTVPASPTPSQTFQRQQASQKNFDRISMTRLMALLSYGSLKGRGIQLRDILLIASRIDIDAGD